MKHETLEQFFFLCVCALFWRQDLTESINEWVLGPVCYRNFKSSSIQYATVGLASECSQNFLTQTSWVITGTRASSSDWSLLRPMSHFNQPNLRQIFVFQQTHPPVIRQTENTKFVVYQLNVLIRNNSLSTQQPYIHRRRKWILYMRCRNIIQYLIRMHNYCSTLSMLMTVFTDDKNLKYAETLFQFF